MAKGAESKTKIFDEIIKIFPDAFFDDKVLRVPMVENGETIEIKVALTAAKDVIGTSAPTKIDFTEKEEIPQSRANFVSKPTQAEIDNVQSLLNALDF
jgi:hypothetical protein